MIATFLTELLEASQPGKIEFHAKPRTTFDEEAAARIMASQQARWGEFFDLSLVLTDDIKRTPTGKIIRYVVGEIGQRR